MEYLRSSSGLRSLETVKTKVAILRQYFGGREMGGITGQDVKAYIRQRREAGRSNATVNRELAALSAAINHYNAEYDWDLPNPVKGRKLEEDNHRERYLTKAEVGRLVSEARLLRHGDLLADFIELAVHTGCRKGELLGLEWDRVSLDRSRESITLQRRHTKSGKPRVVPLNSVAQAAIKRRASWRAEHSPGCAWVFARPGGGPVRSLRNGFERAAERAGLSDLRIHDLRHTAASWLVSEGVPLEVVKDLLGHSTIVMSERYAHLAPHRVREAVNRLGHNQVTPQNPVRRIGGGASRKK